MRSAVLLLLAAIAAGAEHRLEWTADQELVVRATLDGRPCLLLLDTGATHSVLDRAFCRQQGMALKRVAGSTTTVTATTQGIEVVATPPLIVGAGAGWTDFTVVDLALRNRGAAEPIVGLLGADYLRWAGAVLDFPKLTLTTQR
jgi:hypothetical protein